jgi:hypothetical protein
MGNPSNLPAKPTARKPETTPAPGSTSLHLEKIRTRLTDPDWRKALSSITKAEALAVLEVDDREFQSCKPDYAFKMTLQLLGLVPLDAALDKQMATDGIAAIFLEYPPHIVERVCHPVHGIPRKQKYGLKLGDVDDALEAEVRRRKSIVASARYVVKQATEAEEREAERNIPPPSPEAQERIARQLAALRGSLAMPDGEA